jgi:hypothetical protein
MNISIRRNHGFELIFEADNVKVVEDIESREYPIDENGKVIVNLNPKRDIKTEVLDDFCSVLDDMIYCRTAKFDSSSVIERLFEKLPPDVAKSLSEKLKSEYSTDNE